MTNLAASYNPDVLSCIANLSNDEVFTPPEVANAMLDMLPQELFCNPNTTFLDPATKSGVFLREIAKRLIVGLEPAIPDLQERLDHIFHKQVFGIAITELTSLLSRRSLYCSKYPNSVYSVSPFEDIQGNIRFKIIRHRWKDGKCVYCGVNKTEGTYERDGLEEHAYEFIHNTSPKEIFDMKFDVIIGNPPYQLSTGQGQSQAMPIYHKFIEQAIKLNPRYLIMITPSRWFTGGMGLDSFRRKMLDDKHMKKIVDYSMSTDCFPGVDIAGGVNYFLWDRSYDGDCEYTYIDNGTSTTLTRQLNEYSVLVRNNKSLNIIRKAMSLNEDSISNLMSSLGPFGLGTAERGSKSVRNGYKLLSSEGYSYIEKNKVSTGTEYIDKWKVIIGKATSAGAATASKADGKRKVIATLSLLEPNAVCTFSYFVGGAFESKDEAINCEAYFATKFVRFLLLQTLSSINISKDRFQFVPIQDFSRKWTDDELYSKYKLSDDEIDLIESMIKPMEIEAGDFNDK